MDASRARFLNSHTLPEDAAASDDMLQPVVELPTQRLVAGQLVHEGDMLSNEVPVALVFNGISHAVMMATPQDLPALALGFSLSEGVLGAADECYGIEVVAMDAQTATNGLTAAFEVRLEIASRRFATLKERRRFLSGRTGCGVCGVESLASFELDAPRVARPSWSDALNVTPLAHAFEQLPARQVLNRQTGSMHAAGWGLPDGELVQVMEDVGRHNALDKLLGWRAMLPEKEAAEGFVVMTSRASYELIRKCAYRNVPVLAAISAPTVLAVQLAGHTGMRLFGLCRQGKAVQYTN